MKRMMAVAFLATLAGCQTTLPNTATETLSEPHGNGALAIATAINKHQVNYPCETFTFDLHEKVDGKLTESEPQTLRFYVYEDSNYALFDDIKPGEYVLTEARCNIRRGFVVDGKSFLTIEMNTEHVIKPNTVTISPNFIYASQDKNGYFSVQISKFEAKHAAKFQKFIGDEINNENWSLGYFEG
ncbi:hypothetical protein [Vibrio sp. Isolate30]|jgi:hypothetical protein|uniref:hypothetical protein n=1 Tax=Vibrio sp. Isolate30 TaxID=2908536 RepID=UPI001EFD6CAE|nr:hypothetical protein [Vibrio sp. Isolate30]MCG9629929.1 hypothetical protein [Vibrio sp. Isolate30]